MVWRDGVVAQAPIQAPQENNDSSSEHLEVEGVTEGGWIQWFCSLEGNEFFVEVEEEFIRDPFNLYGLKHKLEHERYKQVLRLSLGIVWNSSSLPTPPQNTISKTKRTHGLFPL
jgi:hypothetical protein